MRPPAFAVSSAGCLLVRPPRRLRVEAACAGQAGFESDRRRGWWIGAALPETGDDASDVGPRSCSL
jgi:hypothetical protein